MEWSYSAHAKAEYALDTMVHSFWAWGEVGMKTMRDSVGKFRLDYHISFTGHPYEKPDFVEFVVPLIVKSFEYKGL